MYIAHLRAMLRSKCHDEELSAAKLDADASGRTPELAELDMDASGHGPQPAQLDMGASGHGPEPAELDMDASGHYDSSGPGQNPPPPPPPKPDLPVTRPPQSCQSTVLRARQTERMTARRFFLRVRGFLSAPRVQQVT